MTYRFNTETMFCGIPKMMMIYLGLFVTMSTLENIRRLDLLFFNGLPHNIFGVCFFWITMIINPAFFTKFFAVNGFVCLCNLLYYFLAMFALIVLFYPFCRFRSAYIFTSIFSITNFAIGLIFVPFALIELRNKFNLFTHAATFRFHIMNYNRVLGTCQ